MVLGLYGVGLGLGGALVVAPLFEGLGGGDAVPSVGGAAGVVRLGPAVRAVVGTDRGGGDADPGGLEFTGGAEELRLEPGAAAG
ncbi:hypothetical protein ADL04_22370 [Streptomyces sp. NRRL B-3648]|nr:hypothetical protein ADL04_22370 [Streptomyces sp. NRRL B-3648]